MKLKRKHKLAILSISLIVLITSFVAVLLISKGVNTKIDVNLLRSGSSSITKLYYFENEDRRKREGEATELKEEAIFQQRSEWTSLYSMPENLTNAFIAIEDKRFYDHRGIDALRTAKAICNYIFKFDKNGYGGSTITQQLIKNLTGDSQITVKRKFEEIFRAINLEKMLGKNEILEMYLNVVYLAENTYGVGSAAELYFNKNVRDLSLAECATLASIVQNPAKYDPYKHPENNSKRKEVVLSQMLKQGMIDEKEYKDALNEKVKISTNVENENRSGIYSWFTEAVISDVSADISEQYNISKEMARKLILKGGLNIFTTIDVGLQKKLEDIYKNYIAYVNNQDGKYPESGCVIIDPQTFDVLALVGGTGEKKGNMLFNRAIDSKRPLGSVIKPLSVYTPAIEEGVINFSSVYDDTPLQLSNRALWPKNSPNKYRGLVPASFALEHSINTVAVKILKDLSIEKSMKYLKRLGINASDEMDKNESSLALGQLTYGESLLNTTNAYCALANGGYIGEPKTYLYVTDNFGNIILERSENKEKVFTEQSAFIVTKMLESVVHSGTASFMDLSDCYGVAGKTGTSSNNCDKWFVGYTSELVCGVWTGFDIPAPMYYSRNPSCIIFDKIMSFAYSDKIINEFQMPKGIIKREFCFDSGRIPTKDCDLDMRGDRRMIGYYNVNDISDKCDLHKSVDIDISDGLIARKLTPFWKRRRVSLINYDRMNIEGITTLDDEYLLSYRKREE